MRFHWGAIPKSPDFAAEPPWTPLREPSSFMVQVYALPIGLGAAAIMALLWRAVEPAAFAGATLNLWEFLLAFAGIVLVHELIHASVHPLSGRSPQTILGCWPSRGVFYAHYDGQLSRNRFVAILLAPLMMMSVLPLVAAAILPGEWGGQLVPFISCFNALLACVDMLGAGMVLWQIPADGIIRNQGWNTYWTLRETPAG